MRRYFRALVVLGLLLGAVAFGQSLEQILAQTGLEPDLVTMLTVEQGGQKFLLVFVYIDERTLSSNVRPEIAQAIAPYVGQNALMIWAYSEAGANFDPEAIWFAQGRTWIALPQAVVIPVEGEFLSGTIPALAPVAAIVVLGEAIDPAQPFEIHYGDVAMASMTVAYATTQSQAEATAEVQAAAQAKAQAQAEASAQGEASVEVQAEVQAQGLEVETEPCGPCAEAQPCGCDPCAWLSSWWTSCCPEGGCDPCDPCSGGLIVPFLLLLLLGL